jgi:hypothetical protein
MTRNTKSSVSRATVRRTSKAKPPLPPPPLPPPYGTPEWIAYRKAAIAKTSFPNGMDYGDPTSPVGHACGVRISSRLTRDYRHTHRKLAMDIYPQEVIDVLVKAGVKKWVLMGLHGYVGYMSDPRATQDVDILVAAREKKKAIEAVKAAWPTLIVQEYPEVVRFRDPNDPGYDGQPKPTIDIMLPVAKFQKTILKSYVVIDAATQHAIPRIEAALVSKYAAMISDTRSMDKKELDCSDFRRIVRANRKLIDLPSLRRLADEVWTGGADEIERFLDVAVSERPFVL